MSVTSMEKPKMPSNETLIQKICHIQEDMREVKENLANLSKGFTKLAVFEERTAALTRSLDEIRTGHLNSLKELQTSNLQLERRIAELENSQTKMTAMAQGFSMAAKAIWAVCGASIVAGITCLIKLA